MCILLTLTFTVPSREVEQAVRVKLIQLLSVPGAPNSRVTLGPRTMLAWQLGTLDRPSMPLSH